MILPFCFVEEAAAWVVDTITGADNFPKSLLVFVLEAVDVALVAVGWNHVGRHWPSKALPSADIQSWVHTETQRQESQHYMHTGFILQISSHSCLILVKKGRNWCLRRIKHSRSYHDETKTYNFKFS